MDSTFFYVATFSVLGFAILSMIRREEFAPVFGFIGGMVGIFIVASANSDGSITVSYPQFSGDVAHTIGLWPVLYLPIFFIIIAFAAAFYRAAQ